MEPRRTAAWDPDELLGHAEHVRRLAASLVRGAHEVDDVVQETLTIALERPPRDASHPRAWLAGVARNVVRNRRRSATRLDRRERAAARREGVPDPTEVGEHLELQQLVLAMASRLGEPYRTAVYLRYFEELTPTEIAARLDEPLATIKTRLRRALDQIRKDLDRRHGGDRAAWRAALAPLLEAGLPARVGVGGALAVGALLVVLAGGLVWWLLDAGRPSDAPPRPMREAGAATDASASPSESDAPSLQGRPDGEAAGTKDVPPAPVHEVRVALVFQGVRPSPVRLHLDDAAGADRMLTVGAGLVDADEVGGPGSGLWAWADEGGEVSFEVEAGAPCRLWVDGTTAVTCPAYPFTPVADEDTRIALVLSRAAPLRGRVVDATTGEGIAGAIVRLRDEEGASAPGWRTHADALGDYTLPAVPAASGKWWSFSGWTSVPMVENPIVCAWAGGYALATQALPFPTEGAFETPELDLRLTTGGTVAGRVLGPGEEPIADCRVALRILRKTEFDEIAPLGNIETWPWQEEATDLGALESEPVELRPPGMPWLPPLVTRTDAGGRFVIFGARLDVDYELRAVPAAASSVAASPIRLTDGQRERAVDLAAEAFCTLDLSVVDWDTGEPVLDFRIPRDEETPAALGPGQVRLSRVHPEETWLRILSETHTNGYFPIAPESGRTVRAVVRMVRSLPIRGRVVDRRGQPVSDAQVYVDTSRSDTMAIWGRSGTETAEDGTFEIAGFPPGRWAIDARGRGFETLETWVTTPGDPAELVLDPAPPQVERAVSLRVQLAEGAPSPDGVQVHYIEPAGFIRDVARGADPRAGSYAALGWTTEAVHVPLGFAPPHLALVAPGLAAATFDWTPGADVSLTLEVGRMIEGQVVDADRRPLPGAVVVAEDGFLPGAWARTDERGRFRLPHVPTQTTALRAYALQHVPATVEIPRSDDPIEIPLAPAILVTARLSEPARTRDLDGPAMYVYRRSAEGAAEEFVVALKVDRMTWSAPLELEPGHYRVRLDDRRPPAPGSDEPEVFVHYEAEIELVDQASAAEVILHPLPQAR